MNNLLSVRTTQANSRFLNFPVTGKNSFLPHVRARLSCSVAGDFFLSPYISLPFAEYNRSGRNQRATGLIVSRSTMKDNHHFPEDFRRYIKWDLGGVQLNSETGCRAVNLTTWAQFPPAYGKKGSAPNLNANAICDVSYGKKSPTAGDYFALLNITGS